MCIYSHNRYNHIHNDPKIFPILNGLLIMYCSSLIVKKGYIILAYLNHQINSKMVKINKQKYHFNQENHGPIKDFLFIAWNVS